MTPTETEPTRTRSRRSTPAKATTPIVAKKRRTCFNLSAKAYERLVVHALKVDKDPCEVVEELILANLRQWTVRYIGERGQEGSEEDSADRDDSPGETLPTGEDSHPSPSPEVVTPTGEGERSEGPNVAARAKRPRQSTAA